MKIKVFVAVSDETFTENQLNKFLKSYAEAISQAEEFIDAKLIFMGDKLPQAMASLGAQVVHLKWSEQKNLSSAYNEMARYAFNEGGGAALITAKIDGFFHHQSILRLVKAFQSRPEALCEMASFPEENPKIYDEKSCETPWTSARGLLIPKSIFQAMQGFDEALKNHLYDVDFSWRARAAGFKIYAVPEAIYSQATGRSSRQEFLLAGRTLAHKWQNQSFLETCERELVTEFKMSLSPLPPPESLRLETSIAHFSEDFNFSDERWTAKNFVNKKSADPETVTSFEKYMRQRNEDKYVPESREELNLKNDLLSVIVRVHRGANLDLLDLALFSLAVSSYEKIEVIVVAKSFSDDDLRRIENLMKLQPWSQGASTILKNIDIQGRDGRGESLNFGIKSASGQYLAFLDYDDLVYPNGHEALIHKLKDCDASFAVGGTVRAWIASSEKIFSVSSKDGPFQSGRCKNDLFEGNFIPIHSYVVDRYRCGAHLFAIDTRFDLFEDYSFLLKLASKYEMNCDLLSVPVCEYRMRKDGTNSILVENEISSDKKTMWKAAEVQIDQLKEELLTITTVKELSEYKKLKMQNGRLRMRAYNKLWHYIDSIPYLMAGVYRVINFCRNYFFR